MTAATAPTFRKVTAGHYRHDATGVEITKRDSYTAGRGAGGWYITSPHLIHGVVDEDIRQTKRDAEAAALPYVRLAERNLAADYADAVVEDINRVSHATDVSDRPDRVPAIVVGAVQAARAAYRSGDLDRARGFAQAAREEFARMVDADHTEALNANAEYSVFAQNRAWVARHNLRSARPEHVNPAIEADHAAALDENDLRDEDDRDTTARQAARRVDPAFPMIGGTTGAGKSSGPAGAFLTPGADSRDEQTGETCGTQFITTDPGPFMTACARPAGHDDEIGHALVRFPEGTPEYDAYRASLIPELRKWAAGEPPYEYDREFPRIGGSTGAGKSGMVTSWHVGGVLTEPQPGDTVRITWGQGAGMQWTVVAFAADRNRVQVDPVRGSLLGPQWEDWCNVELISRPAVSGEADPGAAGRLIGCAPALTAKVIGEACPVLSRHAHREWTGEVVPGGNPEPGTFGAIGYTPVPVPVGVLGGHEVWVDDVRARVARSELSWAEAADSLVDTLGVTEVGARALLLARDTASLA